jgi:hypothetical protein
MTQSTLDTTVDSERRRLNPSAQVDLEPEVARQRAEPPREGSSSSAPEELRGPPPALGTSYLGAGTTDAAWQRWSQIQSDFVDDPRNAVTEASALVSEVIDDIVRRFETERTELEQRWSTGEDVSTEELRRCLQRYRDFFGRLLANLGDAKA